MELLACAFEKLMHQFILGVRSQVMDLLLTMEAVRKDTKRPKPWALGPGPWGVSWPRSPGCFCVFSGPG